VFSVTCEQELATVLDKLAVIDWKIRKQKGLNLGRRQLLAHLEYLSFSVQACSNQETLFFWMKFKGCYDGPIIKIKTKANNLLMIEACVSVGKLAICKLIIASLEYFIRAFLVKHTGVRFK